MAKTMDQFAADTRDSLPEPGTSPFQHLRHTLAVFDETRDGDLVVQATGGIYPEGDTGITWGDLRHILDWLEQSEQHLEPAHPVFGR